VRICSRIRSASALLRPYAPALDVDVFATLSVVDGGDLEITPGNAQRTAETAIVREIVKRKIADRGYLPIVLGDLNDYDPDVPMADAVRVTQTTVLRDLNDYDEKSPGDELVNAAKFIPRVADRYSSHWDFNENGAADGEDVYTLIDHVLVHRDLAGAIGRVFIAHATDLGVSDHFPVVVDFRIAR
jgi:endonuclease/exonuclease/phosphatase family metal-dependent hydrolase